MFGRSRSSANSGIGCTYILGMGIILVCLLIINGLLVKAFLNANQVLASDLRLAQTAQFLLPVALIFVEFWVYDFFRQFLRE